MIFRNRMATNKQWNLKMKGIGFNTTFCFFVVLLTACSPGLPNPTEMPQIVQTPMPSIYTAEPVVVENSNVALETTVSNFRPVETYYEKINVVWLECEVPQEYYHDWRFAAACLNMELPAWQEEDKQRLGERFQRAPGESNDLRLAIGKDVYETKHRGPQYELVTGGKTVATATSMFSTFDPNRALLNANNKIAWEIAGFESDQTVIDADIVYDGISLQEKHALDEAYIPYVINEKLIFVAKKDGKFFVMYDEQNLGPEFEEISIGYCCGPAAYSIWRAQDQYWFWGTRDGKYYVVALFSK